MSQEQAKAEIVSLLQDLGLKEYEARCFLSLTQLSAGTAKEISDISEVPRTRVYDAIRVLEAQGLVEVQHSNPQRFRAASIKEATETLRQKYDGRIDTLQSHLEHVDFHDEAGDTNKGQEVWSLTGHEGIESRTLELLKHAESEIVLVVVEENILSESLFDRLHEAQDRGVSVIVGGMTEPIVTRLESELPSTKVFKTSLDWLMGPEDETEVAISRLLLVDRTRLLVSSFYPAGDHKEEVYEQAIFANGLGNGVVVLIRRLIATGLIPVEDPGK